METPSAFKTRFCDGSFLHQTGTFQTPMKNEFVLRATNVAAEDFAPRYWRPEPSAERCLEWVFGTVRRGEAWIDFEDLVRSIEGEPPLAAIRAAMKEEGQ